MGVFSIFWVCDIQGLIGAAYLHVEKLFLLWAKQINPWCWPLAQHQTQDVAVPCANQGLSLHRRNFSVESETQKWGNVHAKLRWGFSWSVTTWEKHGQCSKFSVKLTLLHSQTILYFYCHISPIQKCTVNRSSESLRTTPILKRSWWAPAAGHHRFSIFRNWQDLLE